MRIGGMWYPVLTLGYGNRLGIWFQGCEKHCRNCISPEFRSKEDGEILHLAEIKKIIRCDCGKIDGLTISGGEPFDQPEGLMLLVEWFAEEFNDDILIFTGYTLDELYEKKSSTIKRILNTISVLVDGEYMEELNSGIGLRGSTNQKIYVWKNRDKYTDLEKYNRNIQCVFLRNRIWMIGIPPK